MTPADLVQVVMPQMGESLSEGTIVRWLKSPGDRIQRDESLVEISTDKVDTDVPAPVAGVLRRILAREGQTVAVGVAVAEIEPEGEQIPAEPSAAPPALPTPGPPGAATAAPEESGGHFKSSHAPQLVSFQRQRGSRPPSPSSRPSSGQDRQRFAPTPQSGPVPQHRSYSPAVLGLAQRGGMSVDQLTRLQGSGRGGRLTKRDVQRFLEGGGAAAPTADPRATSAPSLEAPPEYLYHPRPGDRLEPMSPVRRKIAHHMYWSVLISPHATAQSEVDVSAVSARLARRDEFQHQCGAPLTLTAFTAAATVRALRDFPILNSSVVGDEIAFKPSVNLGLAVALADPDELVVPVIHRAEDLALPGLARAIHDLATRARARELRPEDVQDGTFTLTNPGIFGGITGTPILNQPQVGILGLGAVRKQAVVIDDALAIRPMMALALTFDHRATDGMVAFRFLSRLRELLEAPPDEWC